jgi:large subunit ribosomal protein L22e/Meckel syndrome type 1 protein
MNRLILAVALAAGCTLASGAPAFAAAKTYDCSKPGNANKAACKGATKEASKAATKPAPAAKSAAKPAASAAKPTSAKVSSTTTTRTVTERNFDCSKPGNANKAVCKSAATTPAKPVAKQTTTATTTRHYDCSKAGNATKQECKGSVASTQAVSKPTATPRQAAKPEPSKAAAGPATAENGNPAGAIAQCKDGTYSHAKQHSGACSRHGGVAKWM